jgi:hypothetical protein
MLHQILVFVFCFCFVFVNILELQKVPKKPETQEEQEGPVNPLLHVHPPVLLQKPLPLQVVVLLQAKPGLKSA